MPTVHHLLDDAPLYLAVKRALRARIGVEWHVGDRLPPVTELARDMSVGQTNAHRAVRDLVAEGVLLTRRKLGTFVRRLPGKSHDTPRRRANLKGVTIGLVCGTPTPLPYTQRILDGFREVMRAAGADTVLTPFDIRDPKLPPAQGHWGAVIFNPPNSLSAPPGKANLLVVSNSDSAHPSLLTRFDMVGIDQYQGGAIAGATLRTAGCTSVCFVGRQVAANYTRLDATSSARLHGFEIAFGELLPPHHLLHVIGYSEYAGGVACKNYLKLNPRPQGVFCASDELARGFLIAAAANGLRPAKDFHLVGFDGQDPQEPAPGAPWLTSIAVPCTQMGRRAAELMIRRYQNPARDRRRLLLPCSLLRGNTVG